MFGTSARRQWLHLAVDARQSQRAMNPRASGRAAARVPDAIRSVPAPPSLCPTLEPSYHIATSLSQSGSSVIRNIHRAKALKQALIHNAQTAATRCKPRELPYKGSAPALTDVVAGHVPLLFSDPVPALPLIREGKVRVLGASTKIRSPSAPDIPPIAEAGVPGFDAAGWGV